MTLETYLVLYAKVGVPTYAKAVLQDTGQMISSG